MVIPVLYISCLEELPYYIDELAVFDFSFEDLDQLVMVNIVKTALDVSLYEPFGTCEVYLCLLQCRMTTAVRTKSM